MTTIPSLPFSGQQLRDTLTALDGAIDGKEATGTAAAAIAAHLAAADPHSVYLTQTEAGGLYAPLASAHDPVTLGATVADVLGLTGQQVIAVNPGGGTDRLVFYDSSTGRIRYLTLGANLTITDTTIDAAGGGGGGGYPLFSAPTGFSVTGSGTASITLAFATGYSLPTTASQASWDAAYSERLRWDGGATGLNAATARASLGLGSLATQNGTFSGTSSGTNTGDQDLSGLVVRANNLSDLASAATARTNLGLGSAAQSATTDFATAAQGAKADAALPAATAAATYQPLDSDLTAIAALSTTAFGRSLLAALDDAAVRSLIGAGTGNGTVTAVTGTAPIASSGGTAPAISISAATTTAAGSMSASDKTKLDGVASGATANATDAQLRDRSTHTGTQSAATITDLASVATSGAYTDLSGRPTLGTAAALNTGTAAGNVVALDGSARLPAVDGSQLTNLPGGTGGGSPGGTGSELQIRASSTTFGAVTGSSVDGSGNITLASRFTSSVANALNSSALLLSGTWVTGGGTSTTTKPTFLIEPAGTTSTGWPTAGTGLGINYPTGFTGWPIAIHQNGSLRFGIDAANNRTHINNTGGRGDIYLDKGGSGGDPRMVAINSTQIFAFTGMNAVTVPSLNASSTTFVLSGIPETIVYAFGIYSRCLGGASAVDQIIEGGCRPNFDEQNPGLRIRPIARGTAPSSTPTNATGSSLNLEGGNAFTNATNTANGGPITLNGGTSSGTGIPGNIVIGNNRGFLQIGRAVTVASLPAASATLRGSMAMVSDANAPAWGVAVVGGGSSFAKVFCNGVAWTVEAI